MSDAAPPQWNTVERIGCGSVFEVYRVLDTRGTDCILKRPIHLPYAARALERERSILLAAADLARETSGPPLLPFWVDGGTDRRGPFGVQTRAPGQPLRAILEREAPLPPRRWQRVAHGLAEALARLHGLRDGGGPLHLVHGDLSPDNIFVDWQASTIAATPDAPEPIFTFVDLSSAVWRGGPTALFPNARGTLPYAAPEVARCEAEPDSMSDVYSGAAILFSLAAGRIADASSEAGLLMEVGSRGLRVERLSACDQLPSECRDALADALSFERSARTVRTAHDLANRLATTG